MTHRLPRSLLAACGAVLLGGCAVLCPPDALHPGPPDPPRTASAPAGELLVGAATVDITPREPIYMAGYRILKTSEGVHDPLCAHAVALRRGDVTCVLVGCDLIGLHHYQVEAIRARIGADPRTAVLVACTHDHAGPDTLGMWGLPPLVSGLDDDYVASALDGIAAAARQALAGLAPARVRWGRVTAPAHGLSRNKRRPALIDRRVTALAFDRADDGAPIATLVHFACHPELLGSANTILSADFPAAIYTTVAAARPAPVVFLNGALGGMVTTEQRERSFAEAERIGTQLGRLALGALRGGQPLRGPLDLAFSQRRILVPMQNWRMHLGDVFGVWGPRPFVDGGYTPSEVMAIRLGPLVLLTAPGEALPQLGFQLTALATGDPVLLVGLGNDELGYLIPETDWGSDDYAYERTVSPGPLTPGLLRTTAAAALEDVGAGAAPR